MKLLIALCISIAVFFNSNAYCRCTDKPVVIAVVDTGFGYQGRGKEVNLCKTGHKDFTIDKQYTSYPGVTDPVPTDFQGHGTNVTGIIESYVKKAHINYCILVLKYHSYGHNQNLESTIQAFIYADKIKADFINYSSGGTSPSSREKVAIENYLDSGRTFVTAAGNESSNLDLDSVGYYPAKYDRRIIVVGMLMRNGKKSPVSNFGTVVNRWEIGTSIVGYGISMSGTSQATAAATGQIVSQSKNKCDRIK